MIASGTTDSCLTEKSTSSCLRDDRLVFDGELDGLMLQELCDGLAVDGDAGTTGNSTGPAAATIKDPTKTKTKNKPSLRVF
ncbi:unnamed protein product [Linum trigynum]|uniref:Uncharacterized protein n=1 Tax=Linum trigynum TaxID=586398 RepID=A0AAV2GDA6_9ROSI